MPHKSTETADDRVTEIMRGKTPGERLRMIDEMWDFAGRLIRSHLRASHPDWTDEQIRRESLRRLSGGSV